MAGALIGALRVSLSAETSAFEAGMKRSQRTAKTTASVIQGAFKKAAIAGVTGFVSAISVGAIVAAGKAALEYAGSLGEVSQQLGVTTKDLQILRFAAGQVGVSQESLETGLSKLTITLGRVAAGAAAPTKALNAIGISVDQLKGKDTGEAFRIIADGLQKVTDRSQRAAIEVALFGKSGAQLDNLLSGGSSQVNQLADAAQRLGIILSDEQIQKADETADKLDALQTVLKARIAGVVADNANAILGLADALVTLIGKLGTALRAYQAFVAEMNVLSGKLKSLDPTNSAENRAAGRLQTAVGQSQLRDLQRQQAGGSSAAERAARLRRGLGMNAPAPRPSGGNIGQFLASGGGGGRSRRGGGADDAERKREQALRDANQFDQEIRRANIDILNAKRDLATDEIERYTISVQIKDAERAAYEAELAYEVAVGDKTKAQADQLQAQYDIRDSLERQKLIADEQARAAEESRKLDDLNFDLERDRLQSEAQLAETSKDQRDIALRLLDLSYRQERARLQAVLADEQASEAAKEDARRRLANLNRTQGNDQQAVINNTRTPFEQFHAEFSDISDELSQIKVDGINAAASVLAAFNGDFGDLRDNAIQALQQITAELIRVQLLKAATSIFGGGQGAAGAAGQAAQGAQLASSAVALTTAGGTLTAAGGTLTGAGGTLTAASAGLTTASAPLTGAGLGLTAASLQLNTSAILWTATAAEITAAASLLLAANAAGSAGAGFASGGYTGHGGVNDIAGFVHGKEFVVNAGATKQFLPLLSAINSGKIRGMKTGGLAGLSIARASMGSRVAVGNDNSRPMGDMHFNFPGVTNAKEARVAGIQAAGAFRREVARASRTYG